MLNGAVPAAGAAQSIDARLKFMGIDDSQKRDLRGLRPVIRKAIGGALDAFYSRIRANPETRAMFGNDRHMAGAQSAQDGHWHEITEGRLDEAYFARAHRIGQTHARIGLAPRLYIAGYAIVSEHLLGALFKKRRLVSRTRLRREVQALVKAMMLDMEIAISVYQDASDADIIGKLGAGLAKLADGDLTSRIDAVDPRFEQLRQDFNSAADRLCRGVGGMAHAMQVVRDGSQEIDVASFDLGTRTERQAGSLQEAAATVSRVTELVRHTANHAAQMEVLSETARQEAAEGQSVVSRVRQTMIDIESGSREVAKVVELIDGIAFQTNLLALNAGIEASRAGAAGAGFAVVANEVRGLAQRSAEAASEIRVLVGKSGEEVGRGTGMASAAEGALENLVARINEISDIVSQVAQGTNAQALNLSQVNGTVGEMDRITQQNAALAEQSSAAARSLATEALRLAGLVEMFRTDTSGSAVAVVPAAARYAA